MRQGEAGKISRVENMKTVAISWTGQDLGVALSAVLMVSLPTFCNQNTGPLDLFHNQNMTDQLEPPQDVALQK